MCQKVDGVSAFLRTGGLTTGRFTLGGDRQMVYVQQPLARRDGAAELEAELLVEAVDAVVGAGVGNQMNLVGLFAGGDRHKRADQFLPDASTLHAGIDADVLSSQEWKVGLPQRGWVRTTLPVACTNCGISEGRMIMRPISEAKLPLQTPAQHDIESPLVDRPRDESDKLAVALAD